MYDYYSYYNGDCKITVNYDNKATDIGQFNLIKCNHGVIRLMQCNKTSLHPSQSILAASTWNVRQWWTLQTRQHSVTNIWSHFSWRFSTSGPTLSPVALLCSLWEPSHIGNCTANSDMSTYVSTSNSNSNRYMTMLMVLSSFCLLYTSPSPRD